MTDEESRKEDWTSKQPWWLRVPLAIASKEGVERLIALVFIGATVYGGYRLLSLAEYVGSKQVFYINEQSDISERNADSLKIIAESGPRVESQLEALRFEALKEHRLRSDEHNMLKEEIRKPKPKKPSDE